MMPYSAMRTTCLAYGESISMIFLTQSLSHHRTQRRYTWAGKYHHWSRRLPSCQNTEGCDEMRPEMRRDLNRGILCLIACIMWLGVLEGHWKIGRLGWSPYKAGRQERMQITAGTSLSSPQKNCTPGALKQDPTKKLNQSWMKSSTENLWECCGGRILTIACYGCYWPAVKSFVPSQTFVSVSAELIHNRSQWVLRQGCVLPPIFFIVCIGIA